MPQKRLEVFGLGALPQDDNDAASDSQSPFSPPVPPLSLPWFVTAILADIDIDIDIDIDDGLFG